MAERVTSLTPAPQITTTAPPEPLALPMPGWLPKTDVIETVPSAVADRLRMLRQRSVDAHAIVPTFEDVHTANGDHVTAAARLKQLTDHPSQGGFNLHPDNAGVLAQKKLTDKLADDLKRLRELQQVRTAAWQAASAASAAVESWLKDGKPSGVVIEAVETEPPKLNKGESIIDGIERLRRRVRELKATIHTIQSAPFPSSYCKQQARAQVEQLATRGAINVSLLVEHDGKIEFPMTQVRAMVHNATPGAVAYHDAVDVVGLLAFLHRDALIAKIDAEIDAESDDKVALSHEARQVREAETMGDLLAVEREESALVWMAQAQNLPCEHRGDANPLAILQCRLVSTAANGHLPPTSPGYAMDIVGGGGRR